MRKLLYLPTLILGILATSCTNSWKVVSPDKQLEVLITSNKSDTSSQLTYQVFLTGEPSVQVIKPSSLGIVTESDNFTTDLKIISATTKTIDEEYTMLIGKRLKNLNHANELTLKAQSASGKTCLIVFRAYNDGIAFRYVLEGDTAESITVKNENTSFHLPAGVAWMLPYDTLGTWNPAYEDTYRNEIAIGTPAPTSTGWCFPPLFKTENTWIQITEADLSEDYCGSHLASNAPDGHYRLEFAHAWESYGIGSALPEARLPLATPWRVLCIGTNLGTIFESNLVHHLASPAVTDSTNWIVPGRSSWSWWGDHVSGSDFKKLKSFVDLAADMGWEYSLVDADWHIMKGGTLEQLAEYAKTKNVGLLIWYNSAGEHTRIMDAGPRNLMHIDSIRQKEMKRIAEIGIKGIKVDFFQSDKQNIIKLYHHIAKDALANKLLLNTHGCTLPRGWSRTYPNFVGMEGVRGAELYSWNKFAPDALWLNTVYPFTRNVVGPMDYTPVTFSHYAPDCAHFTTFAHELALSVIFECGIQHFADRVEGFRSLPEAPLQFLKQVPNTWDDSYFVDGYPGEFAIVARKKGDVYYIAGNNGKMIDKTFSFVADFLPDGQYLGEFITDGEKPDSFGSLSITVSASDTIRINLLPGGGFAGTFHKL